MLTCFGGGTRLSQPIPEGTSLPAEAAAMTVIAGRINHHRGADTLTSSCTATATSLVRVRSLVRFQLAPHSPAGREGPDQGFARDRDGRRRSRLAAPPLLRDHIVCVRLPQVAQRHGAATLRLSTQSTTFSTSTVLAPPERRRAAE
jgi:hypothetical protein